MTSAASLVLTREEISEICSPLSQAVAQVRFLEGLGLKVLRRPDGSPLVLRQEFERVMSAPGAQLKEGLGFNWTK